MYARKCIVLLHVGGRNLGSQRHVKATVHGFSCFHPSLVRTIQRRVKQGDTYWPVDATQRKSYRGLFDRVRCMFPVASVTVYPSNLQYETISRRPRLHVYTSDPPSMPPSSDIQYFPRQQAYILLNPTSVRLSVLLVLMYDMAQTKREGITPRPTFLPLQASRQDTTLVLHSLPCNIRVSKVNRQPLLGIKKRWTG